MSGGIYAIQHAETGRYYIGSARDFVKRWRYHRWCLNAGRHDNAELQQAWRAHGASSFSYDVLEITEDLAGREQWWLDTIVPIGGAFNIARFANSTRGIFRPTPEVLAKMSAWQKGKPKSPHTSETKARMSATRRAKGFRHTEKTRRRISEAHLGNKHALGVKRSPEQRAAISARMKGNRNGVGRVLTPDGIERIRAARIAYWQARKAA